MRTVISVLVLGGLAGCGPRPATDSGSANESCTLVGSGEGSGASPVVVALPGRVDPGHAPVAESGNDAERIVFAQLYETLVTIDCTGAVRPGLAESWQEHDGGRRWTFTLRRGARFSDGAPVTAVDVARCWARSITNGAGIDSVVAVDNHRLEAYMENASLGIAPVSSPALAVASTGEAGWPLGSTLRRAVVGDGIAVASPGGDEPTVRFVSIGERDPRDLLDGPVDVLVTYDRAGVEYAQTRGLAAFPLPYGRVYVLLSTSRLRALATGNHVGSATSTTTAGLARDAIRGADARDPAGAEWWDRASGCGDVSPFAAWRISPPAAWNPVPSPRVVFDATDGAARDLAERVVALATMDPSQSPEAATLAAVLPGAGTGPRMAAVGLASAEFSASLFEGSDVAYVVALPARPADPCRAAREFLADAPWMAAANVSLTDAIVPLAETRPWVIVVRERVMVTMTGDGCLLFGNTGGHR